MRPLNTIALGTMIMLTLIVSYYDPSSERHVNNLGVAIGFLDSIQLHINSAGFSISIYSLLRTLLTIVSAVWVTNVCSHYAYSRIHDWNTIDISNRQILVRSAQVSIYLLGALMCLNILGISLHYITIVGGAIGIGIGLGLQQVSTSFISGLILLFEKTIREGDVLELDNGVYCTVRYVGLRYTYVEAFDGKEIIIPNQDFTTKRFVNVTYLTKKVRIQMNLRVGYDADMEQAKKIIVDVASKYKIPYSPEPDCYLIESLPSAAMFLLRIWIRSPMDILIRRDQLLMGCIKALKDAGIEIPCDKMFLNQKDMD